MYRALGKDSAVGTCTTLIKCTAYSTESIACCSLCVSRTVPVVDDCMQHEDTTGQNVPLRERSETDFALCGCVTIQPRPGYCATLAIVLTTPAIGGHFATPSKHILKVETLWRPSTGYGTLSRPSYGLPQVIELSLDLPVTLQEV